VKSKRRKTIAQILREGSLIKRALKAAVRDAIRRHKQAGVPMAIWRNGQSVFVDAAELEPQPRKRRTKCRSRDR